MAIVDNLVADINRWAVNFQRPLDDFDSPLDTGTEAARLREKDLEGRGFVRQAFDPRHVNLRWRYTFGAALARAAPYMGMRGAGLNPRPPSA